MVIGCFPRPPERQGLFDAGAFAFVYFVLIVFIFLKQVIYSQEIKFKSFEK